MWGAPSSPGVPYSATTWSQAAINPVLNVYAFHSVEISDELDQQRARSRTPVTESAKLFYRR